MAKSGKFPLFLAIFQLVLVFFGAYLALSLFEAWIYFPFWTKNFALFGCLAAVYVLTRKKLKTLGQQNGKNQRSQNSWILHGLSVLVLAGFIAGLMHAGPGAPGRIGQALTLSLKDPPREVMLSVLVVPPDYQGPPVSLFSGADGALDHRVIAEHVTIPEGSIVEIEIFNAGHYTPFVNLGNALDNPGQKAANEYLSQHLLLEDAVLDIQIGPYLSYRQAFSVTPDHSPEVEVLKDMEISSRNSLEVTYRANDDFGVHEVYLDLRKRSLVASETVRIRMPYLEAANESEANSNYVNLLSHPWAGASVLGAITVVDGLGQETTSEEFPVLLPERSFQNLISQRLISIRKALILTPERRNAQIRRLDVLTKNEAGFEGSKGIYLALRSAYWRLRSAETAADLDEVSRFLWQAALALEDDGSLEEQRVFDILERMTDAISGHENLERFETLSETLGTRLERFFDMKFKLFSRRLSLEGNIQRIDIPAFGIIRSLIEDIQQDAREGNTDGALESLIAIKVLFEELAVSSYSQARN